MVRDPTYLFLKISGESEHVIAVTRIFPYLAGTISHGIYFHKVEELALQCFSDADYAGDVQTRLSTSGYVLKMCDGPLSWGSLRQRSVSLSTTESEYVATCEAVKELLWMKKFLEELIPNTIKKKPILLMDNQSAMKLVKNPQFHKRSKHISEFDLEHVPTTEEFD